MKIKMYQWELMDAIENHIRNKLKSEVDFDFYDVTVIAEQMIPIWKDKKHKNGKVVKCEHGYPKQEIDHFETERTFIGEDAEIEIHIDPKEVEEAS